MEEKLSNVEGYAGALEEFDKHLDRIMSLLTDRDLLLLVYGPGSVSNVNPGARQSLADIGATDAENFGIPSPTGRSFLSGLQ